jgi:hypothetical protein
MHDKIVKTHWHTQKAIYDWSATLKKIYTWKDP